MKIKYEYALRIALLATQSIMKTILINKKTNEIQKEPKLPKTTFKEFLNILPIVDQPLLQTITVLAQSHPTIRRNSIIQKMLKDQINQISFQDLSCVLEEILQRCVQLARDMPKASTEERALIIAEQNVLNMSASILSFSMTSRLQNTINNLSKIARGTSLRK